MGVGTALGQAFGFTSNKVWKLISLDDENNKFTGQFTAENLTENIGARMPETTPIGQQQPVIQFQSGETETISFKARIYRTSPVEGGFIGGAVNTFRGSEKSTSVRDQIELLKQMSRKNTKFGRPERFLFSIGTEIEFEVFIRSPGGIVYDDIRSDGTIRGASFNMQLVKIKPENLKSTAGVSTAARIKSVAGIATSVAGGISAARSIRRDKLISIPGFSVHTIDKVIKIREGDTFEKIARQQYGNPLLGVLLRVAQPDKADLNAGDEIFTLNKREILQIPVTPRSVSLKDNAENKLLLEGYLELRGKPATLII
jgi:hypothetical protein